MVMNPEDRLVETPVQPAANPDKSRAERNLTPEEQAATDRAVEALRSKKDKKSGYSVRTKVIAGLGGLGVLIGAGVIGAKALSGGSPDHLGTPPTTSAPADPTAAQSSAIESGATGASVTSSAEVTASTSVAENDPVRGGEWSQLSPELQAEFSALDAIPFGSMDPEAFSTAWGEQTPPYTPYETQPMVQFASFLYNNNVAATLEEVKLQKPKLADEIEAATHITQATDENDKMLHQQLVIAVAHFIGKTDKNAGAILMASVVNPGLEAYSPEMKEYFDSTFETPYKMVIDTAMVPPIIEQDKTMAGTDDPNSGIEAYNDIVPGVRNGHERRVYDSRYIVNPVSGEREYNLILKQTQTK